MPTTQHVFRIGRKPDPWALLSWTWAHDDGTFGNRYDDPEAKYRVLYAATEPFGCFVETLARYRIDPLLAAEMAEIAGDDDFYPIGEIPPEWFDQRAMGSALVHAECADVYLSEWIDRLRIKFLPHLAEFGIRWEPLLGLRGAAGSRSSEQPRSCYQDWCFVTST